MPHQLILVTFPNFPPHALSTLVQEYGIKLEAVPKTKRQGSRTCTEPKEQARRDQAENRRYRKTTDRYFKQTLC